MLPTIAANARKVTEYAATLGIKTCSENHGIIAQDSYRVEKLFSAVAHENYGLLVDMGNFACVDEDSAVAVSRLAPYAFHVHAKDWFFHDFDENFESGYLTRGCRRLVGCSVGEGDVPVKRCLAILSKAGYEGYVSIEYEGPNDCIEGIKLGIENLKSFGVTTE
jgi:sugar phosphate isomerase/epimerase